MSWEARYIGLPFLDGGRTRRGTDCWGLVRLVFAAERGIDLPSYGEISAADLLALARAFKAGAADPHWPETLNPQAFDLVAMRSGQGHPGIVHVGVLVDPRRLLHVERATDSVVVPITHHSVAGRIMGFRRYVP